MNLSTESKKKSKSIKKEQILQNVFNDILKRLRFCIDVNDNTPSNGSCEQYLYQIKLKTFLFQTKRKVNEFR